jgi:acyl-CoA synthetase (AMP-forming)/AMP-acid ligase II
VGRAVRDLHLGHDWLVERRRVAVSAALHTANIVYGYLREGEGILVNLPMFHVGGTSSLMIALIRSGSFHLVDGFSTDRFWDQVRRGNCATTSGSSASWARS